MAGREKEGIFKESVVTEQFKYYMNNVFILISYIILIIYYLYIYITCMISFI